MGIVISNLTKTPYLVLFVLLGSVGVGTASALVTITMAGDVVIDGTLSVGTNDPNNNDLILFDDGTKSLMWNNDLGEFEFNNELFVAGNLFLDEDLSVGEGSGNDDDTIFFDEESNPQILEWDDSDDRFEFSNEVAVASPILIGSNTFLPVSYNRITTGGDGSNISSRGLTGESDLFIGGSLEVDGPSFFDGQTTITTTNPTTPFAVNLLGSDGPLINFERSGSFVGGIDVVNGTVTYGAFTGSHYAWTDEDLSVGMLVSMTGDNQYLGDALQSEILYGISKTSQKNDPSILGVYLATKTSTVVSEIGNIHLVMAEGNGEVWVAYTGVDINPGDYLISSEVAGHAMKDDRSEEISHIIGRAAEPIVWDEVTETVNGIKHKKISILFNFVPLNNGIME